MNTPKQASPPFKRRSSEPQVHHLRNKPSITIHRDLLQGTTTNTASFRPVYGRKSLFYVILVTLLCSYIQYRLLDRSLPYQLPERQTSPDIVPTRPPTYRAKFTLQDPTYEILLLQSSLRHQNDTWRNAVPSTHSAESFLQMLAWLRVTENGMRPDHKSISAFCRNSNTEERGETIRIQADVDVVWTDIRDRGIGQDVMLLVECDISPFIRSKDPSSSSSELEQQVPEVLGGSFNDKMEFSRVSAKLLQPLVLDFAFEHDLGTVETTSSGPRSLKLHFTATDLPIHLEEAMEHVSIAACLSPVFYEDSRENDEISGLRRHLIRWIEWREHMRKLGVERVNWYGRSEDMKDFVDVYNDVRGTKDIFRSAPPLASRYDNAFNPYHDQDAYLTDCIHLNRDSSDYILVLDYDEFPMINFDNYPNPAPNQQLLNFLKNLDMEIGSYEMTRIPISTIMEKGITPNENSLYQDQLDCINGKDDKVKTFYKSKTVIAVNQHKKTRMYPIGEEIAKESTKFKSNWKFSSMSWDSNNEDNWPKLFHYRWFKDSSENGCTARSPLKDSPGYTRYLDELRADVFEVKAEIEQELF